MNLVISAGILFGFISVAAVVIYAICVGWNKTSFASRFLAICLAMSFIAFANCYIADALPFELKGGGPAQGKIENGHYFVGNHGRYTEVSPRFFRNTLLYQQLSFWLAMTLLVITVTGISIRVRQSPKPVPPPVRDILN